MSKTITRTFVESYEYGILKVVNPDGYETTFTKDHELKKREIEAIKKEYSIPVNVVLIGKNEITREMDLDFFIENSRVVE